MNIYVDVDLRQVVVSPTQRSPIGTIEVKNQDTIDFDIYFVQAGTIIDLGSGAALKFGLVAQGQTTLLVLTTAFTYDHDAAGNPFYQGQPVFNTTQMGTAMGSNKSILCTGEIRFEQPDGEIIHSLTIPFQVDLTLVPETGVTPPTISGTYPDASTLVLLSQGNAAGGWLQLDSGGLIVDAKIPGTVERLTNKNQPTGYPGLTAGKIAGSIVPVDGSTIGLNSSGQLSFIGTILASLTDFETSAGVSLIHDAAGVLNRLVAGTGITFDTSVPGEITLNVAVSSGGITALSDAETSSGVSLLSSTAGILRRLAAGSNITFDTTTVPGSIIINGSGGSGGGSLTLVDAETTAGKTLLGATNGQIKRLIAGTNITFDDTTTPGALILAAAGGGGGGSLTLIDEETTTGQTLLGATNGMVKRLIAGTNITLDTTTTPGAVIINAAGGGGGGGSAVFAQIISTNSFFAYTDAAPYPFTAIVTDASGFWNSSHPERLTVPAGMGGLYLATWNYNIAFAAAGSVCVCIATNGWHGNGPAQTVVAPAASTYSNTLTGLMQLLAGDYINCVSSIGFPGASGAAPSNWGGATSASVGANSQGVGPSPMLTLVKVG